MQSITDKAKWHWEDAVSDELAVRHIAVFMLCAARAGFTNDEVNTAAINADPCGYVLRDFDGVFASTEVLNDAGQRFAAEIYPDEYPNVYADLVYDQDQSDFYGEVDLALLVADVWTWFQDACSAFRGGL